MVDDSGAGDAPPIGAELARRLVETQFPQWAHLPVTPADPQGWDNRTFRLGTELSVRLPSDGRYAAQVAKEQRWLPLLAPHLPLPVPAPIALGGPGCGYPWPWSVHRWLDGRTADLHRVGDLTGFAVTLARFLASLGRVDPSGGPAPGPHNFWRGGPLTTYADETLNAIDALGREVPRAAVLEVWAAAEAAVWCGRPQWFHGDVAVGNLLVRDGRLAAVIDFGTCGVGDPACDVVIAWTLLRGRSREAFRSELAVDADMWARGRGWALWKALITLRSAMDSGSAAAAQPRRDIEQVLADYAQHR